MSADRRGRRVLVRGAALAGVAMFVLVVNAGPASAHADLVRSDPASGSTVAEQPSVIKLWFSEGIAERVSSARLVGGDGANVAGTSITTPREEPQLLELALPRLRPGTYGVLWRVLAEDDGHITSGTMVFSVGVFSVGDRSATPDLGAGPSGAPAPLDVALRWAWLCVLAGLVGGLAVVGLVLPRVRAPDPADPLAPPVIAARQRILALTVGCASLGVLVGLLGLVEEVRRLTPLGGSWASTCADLLSGTQWGRLWLVREAAMLVLVPALLALRRDVARSPGRRTPVLVAAAGTLAVVWGEALGSHAAAVESDRLVAVAADALHILAACLWLGVLPALVLMAWPHTVDGGSGSGVSLLRAGRGPLTRLLAVSVGVVLVTGLYNAGRQVRAVEDLVDTSYGRTLLVKTGVLVVLLALGLVNATRLHQVRLRWVPARPADVRRPLTRRLVGIELTIGALLLLVAGVLAETAPVRGDPATQPAADAATRSGSVADLVVTVSATPNRPGVDGFTLIAASSRRPAPAVIESVHLELTFGTRHSVVALRETGPDRYFGTAQVDAPGPGRIDVVLFRAGQRVTVPFSWEVDPSLAAATSGAGPSHPLAPYLNGLALLLIAGAALFLRGFRRVVRPDSPPSDEGDSDAHALTGSRT